VVNEQLLHDLLFSYDVKAFDELDQLGATNADDCCDTAWAFLLLAGADGQHVASGLCERALRTMERSLGKEVVENRIEQEWAELSAPARENISARAFSDPELLSTKLAQKLISSKDTGLDDRLNLIGNLVMHRSQRGISVGTIHEMLVHLADSTDPADQEEVAKFAQRIRNQL